MSIVSGYKNMRIGVKIIASSVIVAVMFLGVVWFFDRTVGQVRGDYESLLDRQVAIKTQASAIKVHMLQARRREKDFLMRLDEKYISAVGAEVDAINTLSATLRQLEEDVGNSAGVARASQIDQFIDTYHKSFQALADSWKKKGLTHEMGYRGEFRNAAHALQTRIDDMDTAQLAITLLQLRRAEKDYPRLIHEMTV